MIVQGETTVAPEARTGFRARAGQAGNQDTLSLAPGGSLSGGLDGGPAGYDTLAIVGGSYTDVACEATGPDSGVIWLDGVPLRYAGLEPVTDNANAVNRVLTASGSADAIIIADGAGEQITVLFGDIEVELSPLDELLNDLTPDVADAWRDGSAVSEADA